MTKKVYEQALQHEKELHKAPVKLQAPTSSLLQEMWDSITEIPHWFFSL